MRDHRIRVGALDVGNAAEYRGGRPACVDGEVLQGRQRVDLVLRGLQGDRVGDPVGGIQPVCRCHLERAGQINDQAVGDVSGSYAGELSPRTIDIDVERGRVGRLLDTRVRDARYVPDGRE